jgi:hypothetical protein
MAVLPILGRFKVAAARGLWHPTVCCIATTGGARRQGAVDRVVPAESLIPASDGWAGPGSSRTCRSSPPTAVVQEQLLDIKVLDGSVSIPLFSHAFSFQIARLPFHIKNRYSDMLKHAQQDEVFLFAAHASSL